MKLLINPGLMHMNQCFNYYQSMQSRQVIMHPFIHPVSSTQVPNTGYLNPTVRLNRINIGSSPSFHIPSSSINSCYHNGPRVVLSPLKTSIIRASRVNKRHFRSGRRRVYPKINKCNSKRCMCCNYLSVNSNIKSTVNGRIFNVLIDKDVD